MTTLDTVTSFAARVEANAARRAPIEWRRVFLAMLSALPYLVGTLAGRVVYCVRIMAAATREGYHAASAPTPVQRRPRAATVAAQSTVDA